MTDLEIAARVAADVAEAGGHVYFVGGFVRDGLTGTPCKDIDLEVYGISPETLRRILARRGEVLDKGVSFGVLGLRHTSLDVAMPRRERRTGEGHRDFDVSVNPYLSTREASMRRDFTINAMMRDVLTGELIDHWGGEEDLRRRVIRRVNPDTFREDALRVFRAAQFAARLDGAVDPDTLRLCADMDVTALSRERVYEETNKALLKAERPSVYFRLLRDMNHLREFFPELETTIGVEQNPQFHPEGDVFEHTMLVVDAAAGLRGRASDPLSLMYAALLHDLGKVVCTVKDPVTGRISSVGHEVAGLPLVEAQLRRLTDNARLIERVLNHTQLHMRPNMVAAHHSKKKKTRAMFDLSAVPEDLILLSRADCTGKLDKPYDERNEVFLNERLEDYRAVMRLPMLTGKDLIAAGFEAGPQMGEALRRARQLHFAGLSPDAALAQLIAEREYVHK